MDWPVTATGRKKAIPAFSYETFLVEICYAIITNNLNSQLAVLCILPDTEPKERDQGSEDCKHRFL